jgi:parallel beta-helix repeat protein
MFASALNIQPARASGTIYIRADGSIDPPTVPVSTTDNVTYTLTDSINDSIVVERDAIIIDGAGHIVDGTTTVNSQGITLEGRTNVTIKNTIIVGFGWGIGLYQSHNNHLTQNKISNIDAEGIYLSYSSDNLIDKNTLTNIAQYGLMIFQDSQNNQVEYNDVIDSDCGIYVGSGPDNMLARNTIMNNRLGMWAEHSYNITLRENSVVGNKSKSIYGMLLTIQSSEVIGNTIANCPDGLRLAGINGCRIFHNNFINNTSHITHYYEIGSNQWDDGYPSGGNYWSDYTGVDVYNGPSQNIPGIDGIGDTSYIIDANNVDNYPLIHSYGSVQNLNTNLVYLTIQSAVDALETLDGHTILVEAGVYYENVVVHKSVSLVGEDRTTAIIDANNTGKCIFVTDMTHSGRAINCSIEGFTIRNSGVGYSDGVRNGGIVMTQNGRGNVSIQNNIVVDNAENGIMIDTACVVAHNAISNCGIGIFATQGCHDTIIKDNSIANCSAGISSHWQSGPIQVIRNNISNNAQGINLDTPGSLVYHNNFINNTEQVHSTGYITEWDHSYPSGGNYWSDHDGTDVYSGPNQNAIGSDGICDQPYVIDGSNMDRYPLTHLYVRVLGDINDDRVVDIYDAIMLAKAYNSKPENPNWKQEADLNRDGVIDIYDAIILANNYGKTA